MNGGGVVAAEQMTGSGGSLELREESACVLLQRREGGSYDLRLPHRQASREDSARRSPPHVPKTRPQRVPTSLHFLSNLRRALSGSAAAGALL